jgi:N6-adenosine-specific RNA methylase IME4
MKFDVIVADCPWPFADKLKMSDVRRGAEANYTTMTISDIQGLPVKDICNPDGAVLCLWVPSSLLQEGLDTMKVWGFKHKQTYVWVKAKKFPLKELVQTFSKDVRKALKDGNWDAFQAPEIRSIFSTTAKKFSLTEMLAFGMGRLFRQTHEICLIGVSGKRLYKQLQNKSQRSVCFAQNLKHSAKPEALQDSLEIMFPSANKIELFARRVRSNWTCLGNEIDGKDIRNALAELF